MWHGPRTGVLVYLDTLLVGHSAFWRWQQDDQEFDVRLVYLKDPFPKWKRENSIVSPDSATLDNASAGTWMSRWVKLHLRTASHFFLLFPSTQKALLISTIAILTCKYFGRKHGVIVPKPTVTERWVRDKTVSMLQKWGGLLRAWTSCSLLGGRVRLCTSILKGEWPFDPGSLVQGLSCDHLYPSGIFPRSISIFCGGVFSRWGSSV